MTTPSHYQTTGLTAHVWQPTVAWAAGSPNTVTITPKGAYLRAIRNYSTLSLVHKALGGYWSGSVAMDANQAEAEWWLENGIALFVEVVDETGGVVWEGFVNQVSMNLAGYSLTRGPLLDAGNRCVVSYAPIDTNSAEPTLGTRTNTAVGENAASQRKFGILYAYISTGGVTDAEALQVRDLFLAENAEPKLTGTFDLSGNPQSTSVNLELAGYVQTFSQWPYVQTTLQGLTNLSTKLAAVVDADPNNLFASANADITTNAIQVPRWESKDRDAWSIIQGLVGLGDTTDLRYTFMVGAGRHITYAPMPTTVEYHQRVSDNRQEITTPGGARVAPWRVEAGKWVLVPDMLVGAPVATSLRDDPRARFAGQVTYTAPWTLSIQGESADLITQRLARYGLDGME